MNKLELVVTAQDNELDVDLDIDGVHLKGFVDVPYLLRSLEVPASEYYLLTCSCGVAGCAGIDDMIVQHIDYATNVVHWHFPNNSYGESFNGKTFTFELNQFMSEIEKFKNEIRDLEKRGGRLMHFYSDKMGLNNQLEHVALTMDEADKYPIHEGDHIDARKILLYSAVSSIRDGMKHVKISYGSRESYRYDIRSLVNNFYEELAARTNDLRFNPKLYTLAIVYINDCVREGQFIDDAVYFDGESTFKHKMLRSAVVATFNKMLRLDNRPLKSVRSVQLIKITSENEEQ